MVRGHAGDGKPGAMIRMDKGGPIPCGNIGVRTGGWRADDALKHAVGVLAFLGFESAPEAVVGIAMDRF